ncbi:MAG: hypothetical protein ACLFTV_01250 [Desulfococcaceae bacterium]
MADSPAGGGLALIVVGQVKQPQSIAKIGQMASGGGSPLPSQTEFGSEIADRSLVENQFFELKSIIWLNFDNKGYFFGFLVTFSKNRIFFRWLKRSTRQNL